MGRKKFPLKGIFMTIKVIILNTVGTSIKKNFEEYLINHNKKFENGGIWTSIKDHTKDYDEFINEFINNLVENGLKYFSKSFPSAEIQSLWLFFEKSREFTTKEWDVEKIILYHTETEEDGFNTGEICANAVKKIINEAKKEYKKGISDKTEVITESFKLKNIDNTENFKAGLIDLFTKCRQQIEDARKNSKFVILNITGGYKAIIPFTSLFGFLERDIKTIYGFEEAKEDIISIPPLPLNWDYRIMDEFRVIFTGLNKEIDAGTYNILYPKVQVFFDANEVGGKYIKNSFGDLISDVYEKERHRRYGYGAPLLEKFKNRDDFREKIEKKLNEWEYLWIGDQIPETVEHTRNHSLRLLELAYYFLELTGLSHSDEDLFLLISAIWLHDTGHSALTYKFTNGYELKVAEFPSLVRGWHNLLSYVRIKDKNPLEDKETSGSVALICKYHRNKMPLYGAKTWQDEIFTEISVESLEKTLNSEKIKVYSKEIEKEKVLLITSILRFIDACDVQSDRVVTPEYRDLREKRTKEEIDYYLTFLEKRKELWDLLSEPNTLNLLYCKVKEFLNKYKNLKDTWTRMSKAEKTEMENKYKEIQKEIKQELKACIDDRIDKSEREIVQYSLGLLDRILFKKIQEAHFIKHSGIKVVYFRKDTEGLGVYLVPDKDAPSEDTKEVAEEIWKEYKDEGDKARSAEKSFEKANIKITGVYNAATGEKIYPVKEILEVKHG
jgi:putative CRISPR-associated protein (TIGR02619 family)